MRHLLPRGRAAPLLLSLSAALMSHPAAATAAKPNHGKRHHGRLEHTAYHPLRPGNPAGLMDRLDEERVMLGAMSMLGTRYRLGSRKSTAVDCSLLVQRIYAAIGMDLPRTTREQIHLGEPVHVEALRKGDLLFYRWQGRNLHVAIYMDNGYILHASPREGKVVMTQLNPSWSRRLVAVRRVLYDPS
ncbi:C40 family peptidase [Solimonas sp. K1W22B-7]|uniref:C40 family peptidase n=1 Tax=Solimonas sp. K1W22B-7 TaxID=2303331 RepID=UPI0013C4D3F7|nr:C40 family peptidase [Solimonas sp. K1W22B-7]